MAKSNGATMLVLAGKAFNFDYTTYDGATGLDVAAQVWDNSSGIPGSLVSTVPMTHTSLGAYIGQFTPGDDKKYSVISTVYTDGTYATRDPDRPTATTNVRSVNLSSADIITEVLALLRAALTNSNINVESEVISNELESLPESNEVESLVTVDPEIGC